MEKIEKLKLMDKILRELEDVRNSENSVLKKVAQLETENINLGDSFLGKKLPDIFQHLDEALSEIISLQTEYTVIREKFVKDNKLDEVSETTE